MKINQVITDYIRGTLLSTQGDMAVRGATAVERLVAAAAGQVLKSGGVGALPAWGVPSLGDMNMHFDTFNRATGGDQVESGFGFAPKLLCVMAIDDTDSNKNWSINFTDGALKSTIYTWENGVNMSISSIFIVVIRRDVGNLIEASTVVLGGDGFALTFVLTGTCGCEVQYLAIG